MNYFTSWLHAMRLRTLPLALSSIALGSFMAVAENRFSWLIFFLASGTTVLLQILSNLANDYGDFIKGTDTKDRIGPKRMVTEGLISPAQMRLAIIVVVILALATGSALIFVGTGGIGISSKVIYFVLGIASIIAAIKYTVGKRPYGYHGFGDIFVFIFFGLVGVLGSFYLYTHSFRWSLVLPATSIGLLSAGVLNLNNMRDYVNDKQAKKRTLVVLMGSNNAKYYHLALIIGAFLATFVYTMLNFKSPYQFLFFLAAPLCIQDIKRVFQNTQPIELNGELRKLALSTLLFSVTFGVGLIF
ncbi:MAG TPA: 1,4-dihydroxy-2-naphthoate polyprenyltransferase [Bacteroidales bacterium]|nr:1,4-dihydroxy-2-naphthoate polyprenyltransferase [Bacteroidales bacterium]